MSTCLLLQTKPRLYTPMSPCHTCGCGTLALRQGHGPGTEGGVENHPTHVGGEQQHADLETAKTRMTDAHGQ